MTQSGSELRRTLGVGDAVVIGLGSMVGAGIFAALGPAARAAGSGLLLGLAVAAVVAYCNAMSSARLAALYPASGGTYVYGRERLGAFWGYLAGWSFIVGKTASCAAMALTVGAYVWPGQAHAVAVGAVVALTAVNYGGMHKSARLTRVIVSVVLAVLASVVVVCLGSDASDAGRLDVGVSGGAGGVLQAAGLLFFAFAGYARIATLGEEVRDPARTIPRAIPTALGVALVVYAAVAVAVLSVLGPEGLGRASAPLADAVRTAGVPGLVPVVRVGAAVAALGSLLALILGVSRTTLAMARDGHLPGALADVHPRFQVPHRAELAVGAVVAALAATVDVRGAIGFSSFGVLAYYAVANASAWTLSSAPAARLVPVVGLVGCVTLAFALPALSVVVGAAVLGVGVAAYGVRGWRRTA
ncbi:MULTISPECIES: APC family permease [unclassified Streptomyces]|uniref:APC family permease n=1 Tax=unclassified Streptomyces TaxID=2593676 RepID=UPI0011642FF4|nr:MULTISPECIES: amino acid permease [unclassified Streptomyces]NMI60208.1 amino acid permease [Streptomyces sp. RLA2-12]QDN59396.1 amino acid permease [Streptomyces sp. S1D4-20]QDN69472.1 amino acid permease [Streptomyces sp. S1D4-14]QDO51962.1 amino acid permease [Streptomyces sp. RLB3-5]QDO62204.1 amino acid permease [Streptomyces sp. RLB1-8]